MIDINTVKQYFQFLSGGEEKEIFTCAFLDKLSESPIKGYGVFHGTLDEIVKACESLNAQGIWFTLHVTLNRTNLRGSKIRDIVSPRALCLDIDKGIDKERLNEIVRDYAPALVVESSPGKYHLYWKVGSELSLEDWSTYQLGLSGLFDGDPNLAQVQHNIRVPGLEREKEGERIMPRIVWFSGVSRDLKAEEIEALFPDIRAEADKKRIETRKQRAEVNKAVRATQRGKELGIIEPHPEMGRNNFLFAYLREWLRRSAEEIHENDCLHEAMRLNQAFSNPLGADEVAVISRKVYPKGIEAREARLAKIEKASMEIQEKLGDISDSLVVEPQVALETEHVNGKIKGFEYDYSQGELKTSRFTDAALMERVIQRFGNQMIANGPVIYAYDSDSKVWIPQRQSYPMLARFVAKCIDDTLIDPQLIPEVCCTNKGDFSKERYRAFELKIKSNYTLSATISRLKNWLWKHQSEPFDTNPFKFYVKNGVIDLETGALVGPVAEDRLLRQSDVVAVPGAQCEGWIKFLNEVFGENDAADEMINFLQEAFGYTLTGSIDEQKIFVHYGGGCNGKSKVLEALAMITGDYATRIGSNALGKSKNGLVKELERIGAKIEGKRLVVLDDLDSGTQWNEGLVKLLTGPRITARRLYEEERDIPNRAKFHIGCNSQPEPETENFGLIRRLCIIPYQRQFEPNATKELEIMNMLEAEKSGILNWAIKGLNRLIVEKRGLSNPNEIKVQVEDYQAEYFSLEREVRSLYRPPNKGEAYEALSLPKIMEEVKQALSQSAARKSITSNDVGMILRRMGCPVQRVSRGGIRSRFYDVVRLKDPKSLL